MSGEALSILLMVLTIVFSLGFIGLLVGRYIYKRSHNLPTGDCASCYLKSKKFLKEYHKKYR